MVINKILVTGKIYKEVEQIFAETNLPDTKQFRFISEEEVSDADFHWADAYVSFAPTENFTFGKIKWVHSLGAGVDRFLEDLEWKQDVMLTKTVCSFGQKIAEYCLSYILKDCQRHDNFSELKAANNWQPVEPVPLEERKVVIYGTGNIGQKVAEILSRFGMEVYGVSLSGKEKEYFKAVYSTENEANNFLNDADYIINTMPLTEKTYRLFDEAFFHSLSNSIFINVGRGASVDAKALLKALDNKNLRKAVLDVFEKEPLPETDLFWKHPDILVTPHISAVTTPKEAVECFLDTLNNIEENKAIENEVDMKKGY